MIITRPHADDAPSYYPFFLNQVPGDDLTAALEANKQEMLDLIAAIPPEKENYRYAEGKWITKQVFIHLVDEERYYAYKAFCYSRQVDVFLEVPPMQSYWQHFNAGLRTLTDIAEEFTAVRNATITLFKHLTPEMLDFKDFPDQEEVYTARSLGWFAVGHNVHHCKVVRENYL